MIPRIRIENADFTPCNVTGDIIALLCVFLCGALLSIGGVAFGYWHCTKNHCAGYEALTINQAKD